MTMDAQGPVSRGGPAATPGAGTTDTEMAQLRMRVVALENLVLALLVHGSGGQRATADAMADYMRPRPGFTAHPLTIRAAARMAQLVGRANGLRRAQGRRERPEPQPPVAE